MTDQEWLVDKFEERYDLVAQEASKVDIAYLNGRIDEFCSQNAVAHSDRAQAIRTAAQRILDRPAVTS